MNKIDIVAAVEKSLGGEVSTRVAAQAVDATLSAVVRAVAKGESVTIAGFGVFEKRKRAARVARNPRTGERVKVRATSVPNFRASRTFKDVVAKRTKLERTGSAIVRARKSSSASAAPVTKKVAVKKVAAKKVVAKKVAPARKTVPAKNTVAKKVAAKKVASRGRGRK